MDETIVEEMKAEEVEQESKETVDAPQRWQCEREPASSDAFSGPVLLVQTQTRQKKSFVSLSGSVDKVNECSLELQDSMEVADKAKNPPLFQNEIEMAYCKGTESNDKQLEGTRFNKSNLEVVNTGAFEPERNTLENAICDAPDQNSRTVEYCWRY